MNRRQFVKSSVVASASLLAPFNILPAGASPNSKLNIAVIGVGGQGADNARMLAETDNIVAFCDVNEPWHRAAIKKHEMLREVKLWTDYRVMFDEIGKTIDAVCVATPDHAHFAPAVYAIRRGKHVYCQKPLCHTVNEVRMLMKEAEEHPAIATQMGHQGHSGVGTAIVKDWITANSIGPIREVIVYEPKNYWTDKPLWPETPPPKGLDWDLFLNRAAKIPYRMNYNGRNWIRYTHFSGTVGDMGSHSFDPAYYSLDLRVPISVRADVEVPASPGSVPRSGVVTWEFPARGDMPPVTFRFYLGEEGLEYPRPKHLEEGRSFGGSVLVGDNASIMVGSWGGSPRIIPESVMKETPKPPEVAFRCKGKNHFENWTLACKGEDTATSPFRYAGPLAEWIILGNIALLHPGKTLLWNAEEMRFTNDEEANKNLFMRRLAPRDDMGWI